MPSSVATPTQSQASQLYELFDTLSDIESESPANLLSKFSKAVTKKSVDDSIYVQAFLARVLTCLAPHTLLLRELAEHFRQVSQQED